MAPPASCESPPLPLGRAARAKVSDAFRLPPGCHCDRQGISCHPVGREKVNCRMAAREAGLGHDLGAPNWPGPRPSARQTLRPYPVGARTARPHSTRPERRLQETTGEGLTSPAPPPPGSGAEPNCRDVIANQIFPQYVDKFVCGRGKPRTSHGGGDWQEGAKRPLLSARRPRTPAAAGVQRATAQRAALSESEAAIQPAKCGHTLRPVGRIPRAGAQCAPLRCRPDESWQAIRPA